MKLRILDNSLRFRLSQSEVIALRDDGLVCTETPFPNGSRLSCSVEAASALPKAEASFHEHVIRVRLPADDVRRWADTDQITLAAVLPAAKNRSLSLRVEKDFACLSPREGEDESDMFPHPGAGKTTC